MTTTAAYSFETRDGYAITSLAADLVNSDWAAVDQAGNALVQQINQTRTQAVVLDLSALARMDSAMVALVVRVWKSLKAVDGRMVVVNAQPLVQEVLELAGLTALWPIVDTREEGIDELGFSSSARAVRRETWFLKSLGPIAVAGAVLCLGMLFFSTPEQLQQGMRYGVYVCAMLAMFAGIATTFRENGLRRATAVAVVGVSAVVISAAFWQFGLPASIEVLLP